jgi:hypothetical protein
MAELPLGSIDSQEIIFRSKQDVPLSINEIERTQVALLNTSLASTSGSSGLIYSSLNDYIYVMGDPIPALSENNFIMQVTKVNTEGTPLEIGFIFPSSDELSDKTNFWEQYVDSELEQPLATPSESDVKYQRSLPQNFSIKSIAVNSVGNIRRSIRLSKIGGENAAAQTLELPISAIAPTGNGDGYVVFGFTSWLTNGNCHFEFQEWAPPSPSSSGTRLKLRCGKHTIMTPPPSDNLSSPCPSCNKKAQSTPTPCSTSDDCPEGFVCDGGTCLPNLFVANAKYVISIVESPAPSKTEPGQFIRTNSEDWSDAGFTGFGGFDYSLTQSATLSTVTLKFDTYGATAPWIDEVRLLSQSYPVFMTVIDKTNNLELPFILNSIEDKVISGSRSTEYIEIIGNPDIKSVNKLSPSSASPRNASLTFNSLPPVHTPNESQSPEMLSTDSITIGSVVDVKFYPIINYVEDGRDTDYVESVGLAATNALIYRTPIGVKGTSPKLTSHVDLETGYGSFYTGEFDSVLKTLASTISSYATSSSFTASRSDAYSWPKSSLGTNQYDIFYLPQSSDPNGYKRYSMVFNKNHTSGYFSRLHNLVKQGFRVDLDIQQGTYSMKSTIYSSKLGSEYSSNPTYQNDNLCYVEMGVSSSTILGIQQVGAQSQANMLATMSYTATKMFTKGNLFDLSFNQYSIQSLGSVSTTEQVFWDKLVASNTDKQLTIQQIDQPKYTWKFRILGDRLTKFSDIRKYKTDQRAQENGFDTYEYIFKDTALVLGPTSISYFPFQTAVGGSLQKYTISYTDYVSPSTGEYTIMSDFILATFSSGTFSQDYESTRDNDTTWPKNEFSNDAFDYIVDDTPVGEEGPYYQVYLVGPVGADMLRNYVRGNDVYLVAKEVGGEGQVSGFLYDFEEIPTTNGTPKSLIKLKPKGGTCFLFPGGGGVVEPPIGTDALYCVYRDGTVAEITSQYPVPLCHLDGGNIYVVNEIPGTGGGDNPIPVGSNVTLTVGGYVTKFQLSEALEEGQVVYKSIKRPALTSDVFALTSNNFSLTSESFSLTSRNFALTSTQFNLTSHIYTQQVLTVGSISTPILAINPKIGGVTEPWFQELEDLIVTKGRKIISKDGKTIYVPNRRPPRIKIKTKDGSTIEMNVGSISYDDQTGDPIIGNSVFWDYRDLGNGEVEACCYEENNIGTGYGTIHQLFCIVENHGGAVA